MSSPIPCSTEMDRKGLKAGAGIYRYDAGDRTPINDDLVENIAPYSKACKGGPSFFEYDKSQEKI